MYLNFIQKSYASIRDECKQPAMEQKLKNPIHSQN
ncbi:hypothetical protein HDE69_003679 [Pedobacter cryoconitis]|uniref:Uncharacterized protein n=1 Tax=Pedobacter cryoconitis TaxID=188932 RepID=A0A7W8YVL4_9SPHI|nr:hypothetical protein [Pedobacter cryoconitis]MBB5648753.1 hypothetical protein [Pedobacter cryoconitis]